MEFIVDNSKSLWVKASSKCINVNVKKYSVNLAVAYNVILTLL